MSEKKFEFCKMIVTFKAHSFLSRSQIQEFLSKHISGDWGKADSQANELALTSNGQLISIFEYFGQDIWVVTDSNRLVTTIMFPEEY